MQGLAPARLAFPEAEVRLRGIKSTLGFFVSSEPVVLWVPLGPAGACEALMG